VDPPAGEIGTRIRTWVEAGGGLVAVLGERSRGRAWEGVADGLLPGALGGTVDRTGQAGVAIASVRYRHPVFEPFRDPGSGSLTGARFYRYRTLESVPDDGVLARFDDGAPAVAVRDVGRGRVLALTSPLDGVWNDLVLQPAFLPLVHRMARFASGRGSVPAWRTVGDLLDAGALAAARSGGTGAGDPPVLLSPGGGRVTVVPGATLVPLEEAGFYELRDPLATGGAPVVAVNLDPAESDPAAIDPELFRTAASADGPAPVAASFAPEDRERRQALWWYVLAGAFLLLTAETALSNRLSRKPIGAGTVDVEER
jgi:hypothetical protein